MATPLLLSRLITPIALKSQINLKESRVNRKAVETSPDLNLNRIDQQGLSKQTLKDKLARTKIDIAPVKDLDQGQTKIRL